MSFKFRWLRCHLLSTSGLFYSFSFHENTVKEINHFVKVCLTFPLISRDTCVNNRLFKMSLSISAGVCLFWLEQDFQEMGKPFASEVKQACLNGGWGNLRSRRQPNPKGRGHTTHQPARGPTFLKGVNLSETVSVCLLVTFPVAEPHSWIWIVNPLFFYASILSLCLFYLRFRACGSRSNGIVGLYLSTSIATTGAVKGNRTEVPGTSLCLFFSTLPLSCHPSYSLSWLSLTDLFFFLCILFALCTLNTCPSLHFLYSVYEMQFTWMLLYLYYFLFLALLLEC